MIFIRDSKSVSTWNNFLNSHLRYVKNFDLFLSNVRKCVEECSKKIFDNPPINADDPHAIRFTPLSEDSFKQIKQSIINSAGTQSENSSPKDTEFNAY